MKLLILLLAGVSAVPAQAYIDPNIGGQLYQALYPLLAVLLGVVAFFREWVKASWLRLKMWVSAIFTRPTR